jgi:hypothetical protein
MSSYKDLTNSPAYNFAGENKWDAKTPSDGWSTLDGSILLQSSYPKLLEKIGFVEDNPTGNVVTINSAISGISSNVNAIIYGNNTFVYAGDGGTLVTTPNTVTWTARTSGTSNNINALIYANNTFVYAGAGGVLATSSDAVTWTQRTSGTSSNINTLTYANNTFVYAGDTGVLATSSNAVTWTARTSGTSSNINALAYGNNTFVYAGDNGTIGRSANTVTWTRPVSYPLITYTGGKSFARTGNVTPAIVSLTDLTGGTGAAPAANDLIVIAVTVAACTQVSQAVTGYTEIAKMYVANGAGDAGTNLFVGYKVMGSTPDTTVTIPSTGVTNYGQTVAIQVWRNAALVGTAATDTDANSVLANPPAITTTTANNQLLVIGAGGHLTGLQTYGAAYLSNFITIGINNSFDSTIGFGSIIQTTAGTYNPAAFTFSGTSATTHSYAAVTVALTPYVSDINAVTYGSNTFVYAGSSGIVATSSDATTWTPKYIASTGGANISALTHNGTNFAFITNGAIFASSPDAVTWTTKPTSTIIYTGGRTFSRLGNLTPEIVSLTSLTGGVASAPAANDLIVIAVATGSSGNISQAVAGYTQITSLNSPGNDDTNLFVGYKVMGSTPDTTVTIPSTGSASDAQTVAIQVWRNAQYSTAVSTSITADSILADPPVSSDVGAGDNSVILVIGAGAHNAGVQTYDAAYLSNFITIGSNDTNDSTIGFGSIYQPIAVSYDPAAFTFSTTDSTNYSAAAVTVRLNPIENLSTLTNYNSTYYYGGPYGKIGVVGFTTYDTLTEFALPTTSLQIVNELPDNPYVKL